ncbi:hypothetical protein HZA56_18375 [Candidatus Poribacteria bacterium]|nr:hypothetical protein [Candidatus Poribacteria bacterium]
MRFSGKSSEIREKPQKPTAAQCVYIAKANGKMRPLGIPTVHDRLTQMAVLLILESMMDSARNIRGIRRYVMRGDI